MIRCTRKSFSWHSEREFYQKFSKECRVNKIKWSHCRRMVATVVEQLGRLDIAINNAGMNKNHAAEDCSAGDWDQTFELNTKGVFLCCQVCTLQAFSSWLVRGVMAASLWCKPKPLSI